MMQVSDDLLKLLKTTLDGAEHSEGAVFRISMRDEDLGMMMTQPEEGDTIFQSEGVNVLAAPQDLVDRFESALLDVEQTPEGPALALKDQ